MTLLRFEANIIDQSSYDGLLRVVLSYSFNKVYVIKNMVFAEQL